MFAVMAAGWSAATDGRKTAKGTVKLSVNWDANMASASAPTNASAFPDTPEKRVVKI